MSRSSNLSQREVGKMLGASYNQVMALLGRLRKQGGGELAEPLRGWMSDWRAEEAGKQQVSNDGV
jgi:transposase